MVDSEFLKCGNSLIGFSVSGHAGSGPFGRDIVCAGVSSAVELAANTITDFLYCKADVKVTDNRVMLVLKDPDSVMSMAGVQMIGSLYNHLKAMEDQSKGKVRVTVTEVRPRKGR